MVRETEKTATGKEGVLEQRIKPTLIRRRAKKVEEPEISDSPVSEASQPLAPEGAPSQPAEALAPQVTKEEKSSPAVPGAVPGKVVKLEEKPADIKGAKPGERKIGVVGFIDLGSLQTTKVKEDWREKLKKGKRRKSRDELEMEAIQRVGGLKHFAAETVGEVVDPSVEVQPVPEEVSTVAALGERIFQPGPSSRKKKVLRREFKKTQLTLRKEINKVIRIEEGISISSLSQAIGIKAGELIKKLMGLEMMVTVNQIIDSDTAQLLAGDYGYSIERTAFKEEDILVEPEAKVTTENLVSRPPVVTVMGHVDHGKTSILDVIRKANVVDGEAGGITQHIGAYEVMTGKGKITFLDTPGHEAFTTMRARGAKATDIVILVVAADDGIMPQTIEAIDHAKAAGVPIVVAMNKIDKPQSQPDRVKQSLTEYGLVPEEWGGDVICVPTSAKTKVGIDQLLEMVLLQAEVLDLKADPTIRPKGLVLEARLDKGRGPVASVLVQEGTLKVGSFVVCGAYDGKIRAMFDAEGKAVDEAPPSKPVEILGLSGIPSASDEMVGVIDDRSAKLIAEQRKLKQREKEMIKPVHASLENFSAMLAEGDMKELGIILKTDVHGSLEAVVGALSKLVSEKVKLDILHTGVGGITESDVLLASASDAVIFGFNVQPDNKAKETAEREGVQIRSYRIIYEMIDEVKKAMEGILKPLETEVWLGRAEVRDVFKITKTGTIAGCLVVSGKIARSANVRLLRDSVVVFEGKISSLKRFKDDAREVLENFECGIGIENFNDIKQGDVIEAFIIEKTAATL